jgi:hypothetical protein
VLWVLAKLASIMKILAEPLVGSPSIFFGVLVEPVIGEIGFPIAPGFEGSVHDLKRLQAILEHTYLGPLGLIFSAHFRLLSSRK